MTTDDLRALLDAADAYKRQDATVAQVNLWLGRLPAADTAALARIALAAVEYELTWPNTAHTELVTVLRDAGLLTTAPQETQP